jgi:glycosyltransferase involved in cell wall biosynthesis
MRTLDKLVIIPTYNEKENIEKIIRKVMSLDGHFHILIVDDGSPDGTADIVRSLQQEFTEQLHMVGRTGKLGLGTAYIFGFKWALENKVIDFVEQNYELIEKDMNSRNSTSKRKETIVIDNSKTRKKREELSISATKSIKKEKVEIVLEFN